MSKTQVAPVSDPLTPLGAVRTLAVSPAPQQASLRSLAVRGTIWTIGGYGASQAVRLASNLVLTRLLFPEAFGLMMLVNVVLQGLQMFSDIGIGPSIIQNKRGEEPIFLNTAWTIQVFRGITLWIVCCILAYPASLFYEEPMLLRLLPVAGLTAVISGLNSTSVALAGRQLALDRLTILDLATQLVGTAVTVTFAILWPSVWALVAGALIATTCRMLSTHVFLPGTRCRLTWERDAAVSLLTFGRWIFASTLLTFLVTQGDRLLFGKMLSMELLGVYSIAIVLAQMPQALISRLSGSIAFPVYSRIFREEAGLTELFHRVRMPLLIGAAAATSLFLAAGPFIVETLYDPRYHAAGRMLQIVSAGLILRVLESTNGSALLAAGRASAVAIGSGVKLVGMLLLIPIGWYVAELPGALVALVAAEAAKYCFSAACIRGLVIGTLARDGLLLVATAACAAMAGMAAQWTLRQSGSAAAAVAAAGAAVSLVWALPAVHVLRRSGGAAASA